MKLKSLARCFLGIFWLVVFVLLGHVLVYWLAPDFFFSESTPWTVLALDEAGPSSPSFATSRVV